MIKVTAMYANEPGKRFDFDYYVKRHMPMVHDKMAGACKRWTVDKGVAGAAPGAPAGYVALAQLWFDSVPAFQAAFGAHAAEILADVPNYTDIPPQLQVNEILAE